MTKADFIAAVLPTYIKVYERTGSDVDNAHHHADWAYTLIRKLESKGIKFSEDSTNTKQSTIIQDVE